MCGIAGTICRKNHSPDVDALRMASERLKTRGPDDNGELIEPHFALAHRRLSIIDLSPSGHQPMTIPELKKSVVYNGEIYNYKDVQEELKALGHRFRSSSDTEVLLRAYHQWGDECVQRFNGMFAFCIYDQEKNEFTLGRDRLGIKPLYYAQTEKTFLFSSNIHSILAFPGIDTSIDKVALHHYMSWHAVVPAPRTILNGVRKLPPGHLMKVTEGVCQDPQCYWQPDYTTNTKLSEQEWEEQVESTLKKAVERRLVADVPVGLFLSGGVDSSLITALMCEHTEQALETFSVGFQGANEEQGDEFRYSDIVANKFKTKHHKIFVSTEQLLEYLPHCITAMNEPMVSYDNIGFYLLSKFSAEHVKVVQSGQGADEIFGGYHWYPPMVESQSPVADYQKVFFDRTDEQISEALVEGYSENPSRKFIEHYFAQQPQVSAINQAFRLDTHIMLVDDPVKRVDSNTMAWGLEARVPFLDHELVELTAQMPHQYKISDNGKYILKKIARKYVPSEVIDRPKGYFPVPQLKYIQGPFLDFVKQYLNEETIKARGLFNVDYFNKLIASPEKYITPLRGSELWQIALIEIWLQKMKV